MNNFGSRGRSLWDEEDGFYYDVLHLPNGEEHFLKVRSMVGLIPLFAVETLEPEAIDRLPGFKRRMQWFIDNHPDVPDHIDMSQSSARGTRRLLSLVSKKQLGRVLSRMLDESEFLSDYGVRALSRFHKEHPYELRFNGSVNSVNYEPAESNTGIVRWKFQLARADLVSGELPAGGVAAEISSLLRRRFQSGVPHGFEQPGGSCGKWRRKFRAG